MHKREPLAILTLGALGVVYGDIGTSPLYAFNEVFFGAAGLSVTPEHAIGIASLVLWLFVLIVSTKYALLVLRADSSGEGGVFALMSILEHAKAKRIGIIALLLMFSAGLLFGEGIITPAISVLGAVEGLNVAYPSLSKLVVPVTLFILTAIFWMQSRGSSSLGRLYGPIMLVWFGAIALLGAREIASVPWILAEIMDPRSMLPVLASLGIHELALVLGAVFLVMTGSEALYADLGHFGKRAIRVGWFAIVFPALFLNYAGQAAYLAQGATVEAGNVFYSMVPDPLILPMIILATLATSIASVALIFGAYSILSQAVVLNLLPRFRVIHTSAQTEGQIYIPAVNWALFAGSVSLVLAFGSASELAAAYGFAVSGVMLVTTIAMYEVARRMWGWGRALAASVFGGFALLDLMFVAANSAKFFEGGYVPLLLGVSIFLVILTWRWGRKLTRLAYDTYTASRDIAWLIEFKRRIHAAGGILLGDGRRHAVELDRTVVFLMSRPVVSMSDKVPVKLRIYLKRRGAVPKKMVLLHINQRHTPYVQERYRIVDLGNDVVAVQATFGFMEDPDAANVLRELYAGRVLGTSYRRCAIEASEDELIIDADVPWARRMLAHVFKFLLGVSVPRYRYFGLTGEASVGLSKTVVPIHISKAGVRVEIPELSLCSAGDEIDPDTMKPTTIPYAPVS